MTVSAASAGTTGTSAADGGGNSDPVTDTVAFGDGSMGRGASAVLAVDRGIGLTEAAHFFKFMIAILADVFVNRHDNSHE